MQIWPTVKVRPEKIRILKMSATIFPHKFACSALAVVLLTALASPVLAGNREQAKRIHDRLVGTPPSAACLDQLEAKITTSGATAAALDAITNDGVDDNCIGQEFYRVTLKNFITPWTNEEQTVFAPLNDYTATVIGIVRDDTDFREILSGDILYTGNTAGLTPYSKTNNQHYIDMENQGVDLQADLVATTQTSASTLGLPAGKAAGVLTTRAAAKAFFVDGTNRAMFRFTMLNHLCHDMDQVKDTSYTPDRIRQDVSRSPGGDSRIFMNACIGCHSGMDPMTQAFAYYDYDYDVDTDPDAEAGQLVFTDGIVQPKYLQNSSNFEYGYVTPNDHWDNYWRTGSNSALGWDAGLTGTGIGASSMGQELAHSEAFARCQVEKVFKAVCLRTPIATDDGQITSMIASFKSSGYKLKEVFAESAVFCMGD
jgi:hypothetical protein